MFMDFLPAFFKDWILAVAVLAGTLIFVPALHALWSRTRVLRGSRVAPNATMILYPVGFHAAIDLAPLSPKADEWCSGGVYVLFVYILLNLLRRAALLGIEWSTLKAHATPSAAKTGFIPLLRNCVNLFMILMGGIMILKHFNYDVMSLITALGVGSLAVGLAAKDTLSNMISGFTLIIDRNLRPGDRITLGASTGEVEEIGLRSTRIKTGDGNTLIVPNSEMVNTKILNLSVPSLATTASTQLRVPYAIDFERVRKICTELVSKTRLADAQRGSWVLLTSVDQGQQVIAVGFWVTHMDNAGGALSEFHSLLVARMNQEGIPLLPPPAAMR
jgi:MscS family membrane protein